MTDGGGVEQIIGIKLIGNPSLEIIIIPMLFYHVRTVKIKSK